MKYENNGAHNSNTRGLYDSFNKCLSIYVDCISQPTLSAIKYDGTGSRTLSVGSIALGYKLDIEIAMRKVLSGSPELYGEWLRLVEERRDSLFDTEDDSKSQPVSEEQRKLTHRVTILAARIFQKRRLDRVREYFTVVKQRVEFMNPPFRIRVTNTYALLETQRVPSRGTDD